VFFPVCSPVGSGLRRPLAALTNRGGESDEPLCPVAGRGVWVPAVAGCRTDSVSAGRFVAAHRV